jgi:predicted N-acyltransferase
MRIRLLDSLADVPAAAWNALVQDDNPFLDHAFLRALEQHDCVGPRTGWLPRHLVCDDGRGHLLGAMPLYLKDNSYGEFVFDWSWASACERAGLAYYPKLVSAIPFTPATGQRLLLAPGPDAPAVAQSLIDRALEEARRQKLSSAHWLFPLTTEQDWLVEQGLLPRFGYQFHWHNAGYRDFADFLDTLNAKKRKNIKRERRLVSDAGLDLEMLPGQRLSDSQWHTVHQCYRSTFHRLGGVPTLTLPFFQDIATTLGERLRVVLARQRGRIVATAICWRSTTTLYGRHWGCAAEFDSLHFEACYYQGIDYCIRHPLLHFEPGAQGEHKLARGFLPTVTGSAHWIAHAGFRRAIAEFLQRETPAVKNYVAELAQHSPYRQET